MSEWIAGPWGPLVIFLLRMADVTVATVRILLMHRVRKWVPLIGFFEMILWMFAVGATVTNLTSPLHILAFAGGYAAGSWLGIRLESEMAFGMSQVRVIVREGAEEVATFLRSAGFGVTQTDARGKDGPVQILDVVLPRRQAPRCIQLIEEEAPGAFFILDEPSSVHAGWMGKGKRI